MTKIRTLLALTAVALGGVVLGATGARPEAPVAPGDAAAELSIGADNAVVIERATTPTGGVWQVALEDLSL